MADAGPTAFKAACNLGTDWRTAAEACVREMEPLPASANLGFLYMTDVLAPDTEEILGYLRQATGVRHWVGTSGFGVAGTGVEIYERPALSLLIGSFPETAFRILPNLTQGLQDLPQELSDWRSGRLPLFGVMHGDPRNPVLPDLVAGLSEETASFLVGGLSAVRGQDVVQIADLPSEGGLSGVLFGQEVPITVGLTQGCQLIGPARKITACEQNIVMSLDHGPAIEGLLEDLGLDEAEDLRRSGTSTLVAFPVAGSDTGDYLVRNLMGIDPERGWLAVGDMVETGQDLIFCRRDQAAAITDLEGMLKQVKQRIAGTPKAALYFTCVARGVNLFGPGSQELALIRETLGDLPLAGFYANGEISNNRLYGYTGVLAVFL